MDKQLDRFDSPFKIAEPILSVEKNNLCVQYSIKMQKLDECIWHIDIPMLNRQND